MAESWDEQFRSFLKRAGDDLKRVGEDIRTEAQKLIAQMQDPKTQEKVREKAREIGVWARQTVSDVADLVEKGAAKAEEAFKTFTGAEGGAGATPPPSAAASTTPSTPRPRAAASAPKKKVVKTVGAKKRPAGSAPRKKAAPAKKTIGRKKS